MNRINTVQIHKRLFLPFKLVGMDRGLATNIYFNNKECNLVEWTFLPEEIIV